MPNGQCCGQGGCCNDATPMDMSAMEMNDCCESGSCGMQGDDMLFMAKVGELAPGFTLPALVGSEKQMISLSDYLGKWVVLYMYPADFTFVCPTELEELADAYEEFKKLNVEILSLSGDSHWAHKVWKETSPKIAKVQFPMLSDKMHEVSRAYNSFDEVEGEALRGRFIIDPDGVLKAMEIVHNDIGRNAQELTRQIKALQHVREHGDVCPANWKDGEKTYRPNLDEAGKV